MTELLIVVGAVAGISLLVLLGYASKELARETYYADGKPYFILDELFDKKLPEKLPKLVKKGPFVEAEDDNLLKAVLTYRGKKAAELSFFPEALSVLDPVEFVARLSGTKPSDVKVIRANKKLVVSGGNYALVFDEAPNITVITGTGCADDFASGYLAGLAAR